MTERGCLTRSNVGKRRRVPGGAGRLEQGDVAAAGTAARRSRQRPSQRNRGQKTRASEFRVSAFRSEWGRHHPKPEAPAAGVRVASAATRATHADRADGERAAANHPSASFAITRPLPNIPAEIQRAARADPTREAAGCTRRAEARLGAVREVRVERIAPRILALGLWIALAWLRRWQRKARHEFADAGLRRQLPPAARGLFPFGVRGQRDLKLRWQLRAKPRLRPAAEGQRFIPAHAHDRMIQLVRREASIPRRSDPVVASGLEPALLPAPSLDGLRPELGVSVAPSCTNHANCATVTGWRAIQLPSVSEVFSRPSSPMRNGPGGT